MGWNYLFIPKLQRCNCWSLGLDKLFNSHFTMISNFNTHSVLQCFTNTVHLQTFGILYNYTNSSDLYSFHGVIYQLTDVRPNGTFCLTLSVTGHYPSRHIAPAQSPPAQYPPRHYPPRSSPTRTLPIRFHQFRIQSLILSWHPTVRATVLCFKKHEYLYFESLSILRFLPPGYERPLLTLGRIICALFYLCKECV